MQGSPGQQELFGGGEGVTEGVFWGCMRVGGPTCGGEGQKGPVGAHGFARPQPCSAPRDTQYPQTPLGKSLPHGWGHRPPTPSPGTPCASGSVAPTAWRWQECGCARGPVAAGSGWPWGSAGSGCSLHRGPAGLRAGGQTGRLGRERNGVRDRHPRGLQTPLPSVSPPALCCYPSPCRLTQPTEVARDPVAGGLACC